jgi:hypothetical protein
VAESFRFNITSSSLNGTPFSALSNALLFEVEARMAHKEVSAGKKGKVIYKAGNQYVNNFTVPVTKIDKIQNSIKYGDPNDIINLEDGTYNEKLIVDKSTLTIQGVTNDKTQYIIDGTGLGVTSGIYLNNNITNTTIKDLTVQNFTGAGGNVNAGIYANAGNNNLTVTNVALLNNPSASGFYANGPINNVSITNSMVTNHAGSGPPRGIVIWNGLKTNITITGNMITNNSCCGIELQDGDASGVNVSNNIIDIGSGDNAIGLVGLNPSAGANLIDNNTITGGGRFGIEIKNPSGGVTVSNNNVSLTTINVDLRDRAGIAVFRRGVTGSNIDVPNGVTVTGNTVTGYTQTLPEEGFGIVIEGTNHSVTGNAVNNCNIGIQEQGGAHPNANYPAGDGNQNTGMSANYFGRGNAPFACGNTIGSNTFSGNGANTRTVVMNSYGLVTNTTSGEYFCNIQAAIDDAQTLNGHTINVSAATFNENVVVTKDVTINGAGATTILTPSTTCTGTGITISANNATVQNLKVTNFNFGLAVSSSGVLIDNVESVSNCNTGLELSNGLTNLTVNNSKLNYNTTSGFRKGTAATVSGFNLNNSEVKGNVLGCFIAKINGAGGTFDNVNITNSDFSNNTQKGMYFEALSNALISGVVMNNSGTDVGYGFNNGIDINLKYAAYSNITIQNSEFTNCGVTGTATDPQNPAVIAIKARDDASSYNTNPASLANVLVKNNVISGPRNGIRFGEFGKINAGPSNVTVEGNNLAGPYGHKTVINRTNSNVNLVCNWHGTTDLLTIFGTFIEAGTGNILYNTFLANGTDSSPATGFQPSAPCGCPSGNLVTNTTTSETFCTLQGAIDDADTQNGHTLTVASGSYVENVNVSKSLTILGPNAANDACTGTRVTEAVIYPSASDIAGATANYTLFEVNASNVTISGLTLDGDNPSITTGKTSTNGADIDVAEGISRYGTANNLVVTNNIIKNLSYFAVTLYDYPAGVPSAGNVISGNKIQDLGTYDITSGIDYWGGGVLLYNNQYTSVTNNCMSNVRLGVQTGNFYQANPGASSFQNISNNTIQARRVGVFHNLHYSAASPITLSGNTITGLANANETGVRGMLFGSLSVPSFATNNTINLSAISATSTGYEVWNVKNTSPATISGGSVSGVNTGIFLNNYEGYNSDAGDGAHATITGPMTITPNVTGIGIRLLDSPSSTSHTKVNATVSGVTISGGAEGVKLEQSTAAGAAVGGSFTGNTITAAAAGINVTRAALSGTNPLTITGNNVTVSNQVIGMTPTAGISLTNVTGSPAATVGTNTITGPFYGYGIFNLNTSPVTTINGGTITGVMQGVAGSNLFPPSNFAPSAFNVDGVTMSGFAGNHPSVTGANFHAGVYTFTGGSDNTKTITSTISNVNVSGTGKIAADCAGLSFADFSTPGIGTMQNITVNTSTISNNLNRGINARGDNAVVTVNNSTLSGNGSDAFGTGGNIGFGAWAYSDVTLNLNNNFITNPSSVAGVYGAWALGAGLTPTTTINATNNRFDNNGLVNGGLVLNSGTINAECNWWGSGSECIFLPKFQNSGILDYTPWLVNGSDNDGIAAGFQIVPGSCTGAVLASTNSVTLVSCPGYADGSIDLSVTGGIPNYTFMWSTGDMTEDIGGLIAGSYTVTITDANSCSLIVSGIVVGTVPDVTPPVITLLGMTSVNICQGLVYTDAGATASDNCGGNLTANIDVVNPVNVNIPGSYTVTFNVMDGSGNPATQVTRTVIVKPMPVVGPQTAMTCSNVPLNFDLDVLVAGAGDTYTYTIASSDQGNVPAGPARNTASASNITDTYTNTTSSDVTITYTVTPIGANGCAGNTFDVVVTVKPKPNPTPTTTIQACSGSPYSFDFDTYIQNNGTALGQVTYVYNVVKVPNLAVLVPDPAGTGFSSGNGAISNTITNFGSGPITVRYTATPTGANGCVGSAFVVDVVINAAPIVNIFPNGSNNLCAGDSRVISGGASPTGTYTYLWTIVSQTFTPSASFGTPGMVSTPLNIPSAATAGNITVRFTATNTATGCSAYTDYTFVVDMKPTVTLASTVITACENPVNSSNGIFNLPSAISSATGITGTTYHTSQSDAQSGIGAISNVTAYVGTDQQTIWVRTTSGACFDVKSFTLDVISCAASQPDLLINFDPTNTIFNTGDFRDIIITLNEVNGVNTVGTIQLFLAPVSGYTYSYFSTQLSAAIEIPPFTTGVNNSEWTAVPFAGGLLLSSNTVINANSVKKIAVRINAVGSTNSNSINAIIFPGSGGESNSGNNGIFKTISTN